MLLIRPVNVSGTNLLTHYPLPILPHTRKAVRTAIPVIFPVSVYLFLVNLYIYPLKINFGVLAQLV